jgi:hypothetical protein
MILAKNAAKHPSLVIGVLKSHGLDAVHVSNRTYEITRRHEWSYQAKDAVRKTKDILLCKCPELHVRNVDAYAECYKSVVVFDVG